MEAASMCNAADFFCCVPYSLLCLAAPFPAQKDHHSSADEQKCRTNNFGDRKLFVGFVVGRNDGQHTRHQRRKQAHGSEKNRSGLSTWESYHSWRNGFA